VAICTALQSSLIRDKTRGAERAFGISSSLFAEQVLRISGSCRCGSWRVSLGSVEFHQLGQVELWLLEDLDLADEHIFQREDLGALLLDLLSNLVGDAVKN